MDEVARRLDFLVITETNRLRDYDVVINMSKCVFSATELNFLGYRISESGTNPLKEKVQAIRDLPPPTNVRALGRFLLHGKFLQILPT